MSQEAEKVDRMARRREVEAQSSTGAVCQVVEMALAGETDQVARRDLPLGDRTGIGGDRIVAGHFSRGPGGDFFVPPPPATRACCDRTSVRVPNPINGARALMARAVR
jgi:hypothetical protein